jgi:hypothetical protein
LASTTSTRAAVLARDRADALALALELDHRGVAIEVDDTHDVVDVVTVETCRRREVGVVLTVGLELVQREELGVGGIALLLAHELEEVARQVHDAAGARVDER